MFRMHKKVTIVSLRIATIAAALLVVADVMQVWLNTPGNEGNFALHWTSVLACCAAFVLAVSATILWSVGKGRACAFLIVLSSVHLVSWLFFWALLAPGALYRTQPGAAWYYLLLLLLVLGGALMTASQMVEHRLDGLWRHGQGKLLCRLSLGYAVLLIAVHYIGMGDFQRATGFLAEGNAYGARGRYARAVDAYTMAQRHYGDRERWAAHAYAGRGYTLCLLGRYDEALQDFEWLLSTFDEPDCMPEWYFYRAHARWKTGNTGGALVDLETVMRQTEPSDALHRRAARTVAQMAGSTPH